MLRLFQVFVLSTLIGTSAHAAEQILRRSLDAEPQSLFPPQGSDIPSYNVTRDLFEGLVISDMQGKIIPGVAEKWELDSTGRIYTFHLRDNAKWSNGNPVRAKDFVFAWQHTLNPETASSYAFIMYPILNAEEINKGKEKDFSTLGVKALDDRTLEVTLKSPTPYFIQALVHHSFYPLHEESVKKSKGKEGRPGNLVSNGAFELKEVRPQQYILATKNKNYWDAPHVKLDKVQYFTSEDTNTTLKRYRAGELDMIYKISAEKLPQVRKDPKIKDHIKSSPFLGTYYYGINLKKAPLSTQKDLREALSLALDREAIVKSVSRAGEVPAYSFVPLNTANAKNISLPFKDMTMEDRLKRAKELYEKAGFSKDKPLEIELTYNTDESHKKLAIAVANMWKTALGVKVELLNKEWKVFLADRREGNVQMFRGGWIGDYNDPYSFLELMSSDSALNDVGFKNKEYDELLHKGAATTDLQQRAEILAEAEKIFLDEHAIIPIYYYVTTRLVSPRVKGYEIGGNNLLDIYYSKDLEIAA